MFELFGREGFNRWELVSLSSFPPWALWAGGGVLALALILSLSGIAKNPSWRRKGSLGLLRTAAMVTAAFLLLEPAVQLQATQRIKNRLAILVDASASMGLKSGEQRRLDHVLSFLDESAPALAELEESYVLDLYSVANGAIRLHDATGMSADGKRTNLLRGFTDATRDAGGRELGGILLFSDGADNGTLTSGEEPERLLGHNIIETIKGLDVPIHTFLAGDPSSFRDLSVHRLRTDDFAFVKNSVTVEADIAVAGYREGDLAVTLRKEGRVVATRSVPLTGDNLYPVAFTFTPDEVGEFVYAVMVQEMADEALIVNNRKDFSLKVIRDKIRVLHVVGRPSWDERFLRQHLKSNPNVDLIAFHILRTPTDIQTVPNRELSLIPFPTYELFTTELHTFDVVIFQNFTYQPYRMASYLPNIRDYVVENGGAFVMVGGEQSFAQGGYAGTAIAEILPVAVRLTDRLTEDRFDPVITKQGRGHPITNLGRGLVPNEMVWSKLPALEGINVVSVPKPDATVLLGHPTHRDREGNAAPVVVVSEMGLGRVMAVTTDSTWFWQFVASQSGGGRAYGDFWNNSLRWLVRDPELTRIHVTSDRQRYGTGEPVEVRARVLGHDYRPVSGAQVTLALEAVAASNPSEARPPSTTVADQHEGVTDDNGQILFHLQAGSGGPYQITVKATHDGEDLGEGREIFLTTEAETEYSRPAPRPEIMTAIAEVTGGRSGGLEPDALRDLDLKDPKVIRIDRRENVEIWDSWLWLVLLVAALGTEWWYRRRWGYI